MISLPKASSQRWYHSVNTRINCQYSLSVLNVTTQISNRNCLYLFQRTIWDLCPQIERYVTKFHFQVITRFILLRLQALKWYIIGQGSCLIWGAKHIVSLTIPLFSIDFWHVQLVISFGSLATYQSFCENRFHFLNVKMNVYTLESVSSTKARYTRHTGKINEMGV